MLSLRCLCLNCAAVGLACLAAPAVQAQQPPLPSASTSKEIRRANGERDIDKFRRLNPYFRAWLNEDAVFVLSVKERKAFLDLNSDEERNEFITQFWDRRNPNPNSLENVFKQEHYRRIVYANEHFGEGWEGWKSDRGRLYVAVGPPDDVESAATGDDCTEYGSSDRIVHDAPARFIWKYRNLHGSGENFEIWFLRYSMGTNAFAESMFGISRERCRFVPRWPEGALEGIFAFILEEQDLHAPGEPLMHTPPDDAQRHPQNRDLEALLSSHHRGNQFPLRVECSVTRATKITSLASVRVAVPSAVSDLSRKRERGTSEEIYGRFVNEASGKVESQFELFVFPIRSDARSRDWTELCNKELPLSAGTYNLQIAVKDTTTGEVATHFSEVSVDPFKPVAKPANP